MHLLIGALVGAVVGVVGAIIIAKVTGKPVTWKTVVAGAVGGAVGGLITAATLGVGSAVAATAARTATSYVVGGAGGGGATRATDNLLDGRPVEEGVVQASAIGAASGLAFYGAGRVLAPVIQKVAGRLPFRSSASAEPPAPKVPEWETYPWTTPPPAKPGDVIRVKIADLRSRQATIEWQNGRYSETDLHNGERMIPEVSWVDWIPGQKPFWAVRDGNHRTFDAWANGQEEILARVVFQSQKVSEASIWGARDYAPFLKSGVWRWDEKYLGDAGAFFGLGRHTLPSASTSKGLVGALGN